MSITVWDPNMKINNLRIECSVSLCFFNIAIFPISFSNAKWVWTSLESFMIELYLYIKTDLNYFPERLKLAELRKPVHLLF